MGLAWDPELKHAVCFVGMLSLPSANFVRIWAASLSQREETKELLRSVPRIEPPHTTALMRTRATFQCRAALEFLERGKA